MLTPKEQAVNIVQSLPDEKMPYIIELLKWVLGVFDDTIKTSCETPYVLSANPTEATKAWERFKLYKGIIPYEIDIKAELAQARDEKYADFI